MHKTQICANTYRQMQRKTEHDKLPFLPTCLMRPNLIWSLQDYRVAILTQTGSVIKSHWSLLVSPLVFIFSSLCKVKGEAALKGKLTRFSTTPSRVLSLVFLQEINDDGQMTIGCYPQRRKSHEVWPLVPHRAPIYHKNQTRDIWWRRK